ncbi:MAG TPA: DNA polymerase III subunit gamma/tau [Leucothrix sp.]|nr:DNA polymerase III subunit gamma/tau [Leucothrix sp.]
MSYQVLARKWRPQNFKEMVGQEHVLRALIHALDSDRLHHAYLFTGTRGVGKTTIARILAKCLNCETGVTSEPCGKCNSCKEIVAGNFVDLIEVDAASRTKVEDTRELLDNVQYAPTRGRYKVYLIDEVHMLTGHSFNALLKTLEEPPPHVKFLFATTDPQKLPVTILSRCLQFNLKRMPVDMIQGHLNMILKDEKFPFDETSLRLISRAADGSMRDALSLLDQSIAFGGDELKEADVRDMLGTISHEPLLDLLTSVSSGQGALLLKQVEEISGVTPDFEAATDALITLLHQIAVQQVVPDAQQDDDNIKAFSQQISKEDVQLYYQIALHGRRDLPLSPDPRSGFEMLLLRMMSFSPLREGMTLTPETPLTEPVAANESKKKTVKTETPAAEEKPKQKTKPDTQKLQAQALTTKNETPPWEDLPEELTIVDNVSTPILNKSVQTVVDQVEESKVKPLKYADDKNIHELEWHEVIPQLKLGGRAGELIKHCRLEDKKQGIISLGLEKSSASLLADSVEKEIQMALGAFYGESIKLNLTLSEGVSIDSSVKKVDYALSQGNETPAQRTARNIEEVQQKAEHNIQSDPFVIALQNRFGAQIVPNSVKPKVTTKSN